MGASGLLTTSVRKMKETPEANEDTCLQGQMKIIAFGEPLTDGFAQDIGADGCAEDARRAVLFARLLF